MSPTIIGSTFFNLFRCPLCRRFITRYTAQTVIFFNRASLKRALFDVFLENKKGLTSVHPYPSTSTMPHARKIFASALRTRRNRSEEDAQARGDDNAGVKRGVDVPPSAFPDSSIPEATAAAATPKKRVWIASLTKVQKKRFLCSLKRPCAQSLTLRRYDFSLERKRSRRTNPLPSSLSVLSTTYFFLY